MSVLRSLLTAATVLAALTAAMPVAAQSSGTGASGRNSSMFGGGGRNAIGLNIGTSTFRLSCGSGLFGCEDNDRFVNLYGRSMTGKFWGAEIGFVDMGNVNRGGGETRAQGINLSLVGEYPLSQSFNAFGKVGTTYGRTSTTSVFSSGVGSGTEKGFGLSYGVGLSYDFTDRFTGVVGWDSHNFDFAGSGREAVRATSLGLRFKY